MAALLCPGEGDGSTTNDDTAGVLVDKKFVIDGTPSESGQVLTTTKLTEAERHCGP